MLILLCGLPGVGKSVVAKKLATELQDFYLIDSNDIRRGFGWKKMPKNQEKVLRKIDTEIARGLSEYKGVIVDSVHRFSFRRHQIYGAASCCSAKVITIEIICPEEIAKKRISQRSMSGPLLSDPNNPKVYERLAALWEDVKIDFIHLGSDHVSYVRYNSHDSAFKRIRIRSGTGRIINQIEKILSK